MGYERGRRKNPVLFLIGDLKKMKTFVCYSVIMLVLSFMIQKLYFHTFISNMYYVHFFPPINTKVYTVSNYIIKYFIAFLCI